MEDSAALLGESGYLAPLWATLKDRHHDPYSEPTWGSGMGLGAHLCLHPITCPGQLPISALLGIQKEPTASGKADPEPEGRVLAPLGQGLEGPCWPEANGMGSLDTGFAED